VARQGGPADWAEAGCAGVTRRGASRGDEDHVDPGAACGDELGAIVHRGGGEAAAIGGLRCGAAPQVQAGPACGGEMPVPGENEHQPAGAADPGDAMGEVSAVGLAIVPEHHAGDVARQAGDEGGEVGVAVSIGEQPEGGMRGTASPLDRAGQADQLLVHDR